LKNTDLPRKLANLSLTISHYSWK